MPFKVESIFKFREKRNLKGAWIVKQDFVTGDGLVFLKDEYFYPVSVKFVSPKRSFAHYRSSKYILALSNTGEFKNSVFEIFEEESERFYINPNLDNLEPLPKVSVEDLSHRFYASLTPSTFRKLQKSFDRSSRTEIRLKEKEARKLFKTRELLLDYTEADDEDDITILERYPFSGEKRFFSGWYIVNERR